jgi:abortive infection bacteriophage resistance protein
LHWTTFDAISPVQRPATSQPRIGIGICASAQPRPAEVAALLAGFFYAFRVMTEDSDQAPRRRDYKRIEVLLVLLRERGLEIPDADEALHYLYTVGHYRLSDYYPAFFDGTVLPTKKFGVGSTLKDVTDLYSFDRRLRLLVLGPLEKIEVSIRALLVKGMGDDLCSQGVSGELYIDLFDARFYDLSSDANKRILDIAKRGFLRASRAKWLNHDGRFAKNLRKSEQDKIFGPVFANMAAWEILQTSSFSSLAHLFSILEPRIGDQIADRFELPRPVLSSILYGLRDLRNASAHHEPLWNWDPDYRSGGIRFPRRYKQVAAISGDDNDTIYAYCAVIHILLSYLSYGKSTWYRRLKKLINEFNTLPSGVMGFPPDWQTLPFWCVSDVRHTDTFERLKVRVSEYRVRVKRTSPP